MYMKNFWIHRGNVPDGCGYGQFSLVHFLCLGISVLSIAVFMIAYKLSSETVRIMMLRMSGATLLLSDVLKLIVIHRSGQKVSEFLPLEICSFAAYFIFLDSLWPHNTIFPTMLLTLFLPAAIMAIIYPTSIVLPAFNFYTIHQFFFHALIIACILSRFICGEIPMSYAELWRSISRVLVLVVIMYFVDRIFDKDFMFLVDPYGNAMLDRIWKLSGGGIRYTALLSCFAIGVIHAFYLLFKIIDILLIH